MILSVVGKIVCANGCGREPDGVHNNQAVLPVVRHLRRQGVCPAVLRHLDRHLMRRIIVDNAGLAVVLFGDGVPIFPLLRELDLAENRDHVVFHCHSRCVRRHRRVLRYRRQCEREAVGLVPGVKGLRHLKRNFHRCYGRRVAVCQGRDRAGFFYICQRITIRQVSFIFRPGVFDLLPFFILFQAL